MSPGRPKRFWLHPEVNVAYNTGFSPRELSELSAIITARRAKIEGAWHDHFA